MTRENPRKMPQPVLAVSEVVSGLGGMRGTVGVSHPLIRPTTRIKRAPANTILCRSQMRVFIGSDTLKFHLESYLRPTPRARQSGRRPVEV
jgi:hypothetical protein